MTPALSHRIARAINAVPLSLEKRYQLGVEAEGFDAFHDLPMWVQQIVRQGEGTS